MTRYIPGRFDLPRGNVMWVWPTPYGQMESKPVQKTPLRIGDAERDRAIAALVIISPQVGSTQKNLRSA